MVVFGLLLDIVGFLLVYKYGLPSAVPKGEPYVGDEPLTDDQERTYANFVSLSKLGFVLIVLGFVIQLFGNLFAS